MKKILFFIVAITVAISSCKKDKKITTESLAGTWIGEKAHVTLYKDDGKEILQETIVTLTSPNYAKAVFNADGTYTVDVKLETPEKINETQQGTYSVKGSNLVLTPNGQGAMEVPFTLKGNTLSATLGTPGKALLKYTFIRE